MNSPNTVNPEYKSSTVDVGELEKLARAATTDPVYASDLCKLEDFQDAANPAAILELISINRELLAIVENARGALWRDGNTAGLEAADKALARSNGEINE